MTRKFLLFILIFTSAVKAFAGPIPPARMMGPRYGFSIAGSGVISLFKVDERHSEKAIPRIGMGGIFRMNFYATQNVHVQLGLEVLSQSCSFNTYYFADGYSVLYDHSFGYTHTLRTYEMYIPLMVRVGVTPYDANSRKALYLIGGYSPKIFLGATTNIIRNSDGKGIWGGTTELDYDIWFISPQTGNVMIAGIGLDQRLGFSERFLSYEVIWRYNLSRFNYRGNINTNELLIKNMCFNLQVGYRFAGGGKSHGVE